MLQVFCTILSSLLISKMLTSPKVSVLFRHLLCHHITVFCMFTFGSHSSLVSLLHSREQSAMTVTAFNEPLLFWLILGFMSLGAVNAATVPESCAPHDLVWIIRAGLKMDNETFDKHGCGRRDFLLAGNLWSFSSLTHSDVKDEWIPAIAWTSYSLIQKTKMHNR